MLCNTTSYYPDGIDKMFFFQDNNLENIDIINQYNNLIAQGKYSEANQFINQQDGIYGYFADFFNAVLFQGNNVLKPEDLEDEYLSRMKKTDK